MFKFRGGGCGEVGLEENEKLLIKVRGRNWRQMLFGKGAELETDAFWKGGGIGDRCFLERGRNWRQILPPPPLGSQGLGF